MQHVLLVNFMNIGIITIVTSGVHPLEETGVFVLEED